MARNDIHRPAAFVPAAYTFVHSYSLPTSTGGWPIPAWGINCEIDGRTETKNAEGKVETKNGTHRPDGKCCIVAMLASGVKFAATGGTGKCSICGAAFLYGDIWVHEATGEHLHVGHTCADKYSMLADRSAFEMAHNRLKEAAAKELLKSQKAEARRDFLNKHPGLEEALKTNHNIVQDIASRFDQYAEMSDKQVALVMKLAADAQKPAEKRVAAPTGRTTFEGTVVSCKRQNPEFSDRVVMTVKMETAEGSWMAWGTVPADIARAQTAEGLKSLVGKKVHLTATLEIGREPHFAFMKRPTGKVVEG